MDFLTAHTWSPYVAGAMIGLLNCIAIVISDNYIGCSTAFTTSSGMLEKLIAGPATEQKPYYKKFPIEINWGLMLVAGVAVGAFLSAWLSGSLQLDICPGSLGENIRTFCFTALCSRLYRGHTCGIRRPLGRRLHQRPWHQRNHAACRQQLGCSTVFLCRRHCHGNAVVLIQP